jgi:hypothetical protein
MSFSGPNILLSTQFSNTLEIRPFVNVIDQVFVPHRALKDTWFILGIYVFEFIHSISKRTDEIVLHFHYRIVFHRNSQLVVVIILRSNTAVYKIIQATSVSMFFDTRKRQRVVPTVHVCLLGICLCILLLIPLFCLFHIYVSIE